MAGEPGHFQFNIETGPTDYPLVNWALINDTTGDVMAVSFVPQSGRSAKATTQWIIDNAKDCKIMERVVRPSR
ncbi:MAG: hypothetical protein ABSA08_03955 [Acidimicrobiales bacterium]|jgi:hypothetical protein